MTMDQYIGTLTIDGVTDRVVSAECRLFAGRLDLDFVAGNAEGSLLNMPFGDATEFQSLPNRKIESLDFCHAENENPFFKPCFTLNDDYYSVTSLCVDSISYNPQDDCLAFNTEFTAINNESETPITVSLVAVAECVAMDSTQLLTRQETFPVRFASRYLPLMGLPVLPDRATKSDVIAKLGTPHDQGGGLHPSFGSIPMWIRYTLPNCLLRFQLDSDRITHVTVMPRSETLPAAPG